MSTLFHDFAHGIRAGRGKNWRKSQSSVFAGDLYKFIGDFRFPESVDMAAIYSYGYHFPMAYRFQRDKNAEPWFYVNTSRYSVTTSQHQSDLNYAIGGVGTRIRLNRLMDERLANFHWLLVNDFDGKPKEEVIIDNILDIARNNLTSSLESVFSELGHVGPKSVFKQKTRSRFYDLKPDIAFMRSIINIMDERLPKRAIKRIRNQHKIIIAMISEYDMYESAIGLYEMKLAARKGKGDAPTDEMWSNLKSQDVLIKLQEARIKAANLRMKSEFKFLKERVRKFFDGDQTNSFTVYDVTLLRYLTDGTVQSSLHVETTIGQIRMAAKNAVARMCKTVEFDHALAGNWKTGEWIDECTKFKIGCHVFNKTFVERVAKCVNNDEVIAILDAKHQIGMKP